MDGSEGKGRAGESPEHENTLQDFGNSSPSTGEAEEGTTGGARKRGRPPVPLP